MSEVIRAKNNRNIFLIIIIVLLVLIIMGGGAFGGYYLATKNTQKTAEASKSVQIDEANYELGELILNLSDENSKRFLKVKLVLAYDSKNKKLAKEVESKKSVVKDAVISVIRNKKASDLTSKGADDMKTEILDRINTIFTSGKLTNVYYSDFLVQ